MSDVAAFDFDGTLTAGGSVYGFLSGLGGPGTVATASAVLLPRLVHAAVAGGRVADRSKELLFQRVLSGVPVERAERFAVGFARGHLESHLRPDVHRRFEWHRRRGDRVVIVSASPELYVAEAGRLLGADGVVATRLEVAGDDTLTGRYRGANCRGDEKLRRLRRWMEESGGGQPRRPDHAGCRRRGRRRRASGRLRPAPGLSPAGRHPPRSRTGLTGRAGAHRYSFFRIHTSTNHPQMGGR